MESLMFKLWKNLNNDLKAKFVTLSVIAMMLPILSNAQEAENNPKSVAPQDSIKNLPSWTTELDSIQTTKPNTIGYNEYINDVMLERGYATNLSNGFTQIAALELLRNSSLIGENQTYDAIMAEAGNDEKQAIKNLRLKVLDDKAFGEKAYEDLMAIHHIYLNNNGSTKLFNADLKKGDAGTIKQSWESKSELDKYLPANLVLKQLGNSDNISKLINDDKLHSDELDGDNLLGTMATHIGPTGTKKLLTLVETGHSKDKLNTHYEQSWVNVLIDKCGAIPYGHLIGEEGIEDLKENISVGGFFNLLTLYHLTDQEVPLDVPEPPEHDAEYYTKVFYLSNSFNFVRNTEEKTSINVGVKPFVEANSRYTYNKDDYFIADRENNDNATRRNTAFAGVEWRLANFDKEQATGKQSILSLSGKAALGFGRTNVQYDMSQADKQNAAERYDVQPAFFDNFQDISANHIATRLSGQVNIGPAYVNVEQTSYYTTGSDNMTNSEKHLAHNTRYIDYTAGVNVLQLETGKGDVDISLYGGFTDTNTSLRNKGELAQDGSSSQSQPNQYLSSNPQAVMEHFNAGTLSRVYASQNIYGLNVEYTSSDSRWGGFAGYSITTDNARGGGGMKPLVKDWVSDVTSLSEGHGQFNFGITYSLGKKTEKRTETHHSYDREYHAIDGENVYSSSKHTVSPTKVEETTQSAPSHVKKRRLFRLNLKNLFGGDKEKKAQPVQQTASQPQPVYN